MAKPIKYKVIKNLKQYNSYCDIHEQLLLEDEGLYQDELELLELLIEDFDKKKGKNNYDLNPVELLKSLLVDSGYTQSELSKSIDVSRQLINDVLSYRRNISKEMVAKLAKHFSMNMEAFGRHYDLKKLRASYLKRNAAHYSLDD